VPPDPNARQAAAAHVGRLRDTWTAAIKAVPDPAERLSLILDELEWAQATLRVLRASAAEELRGQHGGNWSEAARHVPNRITGEPVSRERVIQWAAYRAPDPGRAGAA
jgi:hypothetical protein